MKLSIIVPVYNAAPYLSRFLDCILEASAGLNAEIILVDDGSADESGTILDDFNCVKHGGRVELRVIHQKNQGVSAARQAGLDLAKGEYVIFADPDDLIDAGMYEGLINVAEESGSDLIFEDFFENDVRRDQKFEGDAEELICAILGGRIHGATWNKLIRRSFIEKTGARFCEERLGLCEDVDFLCQILVNGPKVVYHEGCHYRYVNVATSATHGLSERSFADLAKVATRLEKILTSEKTRSALLKWRKGNRFAAFVVKSVSDGFFRNYESDCRDLTGLSTNAIWKVLFVLCVRFPAFRRIVLKVLT